MAGKVFLFLVVALVALSFAPRVAAFGAGNIPSYSYLEDKAFRHGDIEDIIATLFKAAGGGFLSRGSKFTPLDVKRVYFGNWLRDYSQAVDVGGLSKTNLQTIINVIMVLGFLAHGYVTEEFEVTPERLGCYLPTEHIDNPKGYADGQDARKYHPGLRGPVDPQELEIDPHNGMKNYIATEGRHWDTSKSLVRRTLEKCIHYGRQYNSSGNKDDQYQAFLLLGQALHTLEDFSAHSNFCELALISMGHSNVFPHVGQNVKVNAPNGKRVYPLVTGTFGGADFIHSLMGEATDHLSQASVSDLTKTMNNARSAQEGQANSSSVLRQLFFDLPGGAGNDLSRDMDDISNMRAGQPGGIDPSQMSPQELHATIWKILAFRDSVMKKIEVTIDRIPGLSGLVEKITNSISVFIITTLEPFVKPLIGTATDALGTSSQAVIDSHDQEEVWNDWNASDPTHSFLSKDHFALLLNEPAGQIAKTIVTYAVNRVVKAWDDNSIPTQQVTEDILQCLFHPDFHDGRSQIQKEMLDQVRRWIDGSGRDKQAILNRLTSDSVRQHRNKRLGDNSTDGGHVHNQMLPEGGLQQVLAQHNVHVPGANILNAGQDLLAGKKPWDQNFGSGGAQAWRSVDDNAPSAPSGHASYEQNSYAPPPQQHQSYSQQGGNGDGDGYPGSHYRQQQQQHHPQQSSYGGQGGWDQGGQGGYPGQHGGNGGYPGGPPPPGQWGGGQQQPYGGEQQGYYGGNAPPPPPPQQWGQPPQDQWGGQGQAQYQNQNQGGYGGGRQW